MGILVSVGKCPSAITRPALVFLMPAQNKQLRVTESLNEKKRASSQPLIKPKTTIPSDIGNKAGIFLSISLAAP